MGAEPSFQEKAGYLPECESGNHIWVQRTLPAKGPCTCVPPPAGHLDFSGLESLRPRQPAHV